MASLKEYRQEQFEKIKTLRDKGVNPYPAKSVRTHTISAFLGEKPSEEASIAGRVLSVREHGKVIFIDVIDQSGRLQAVIKQEELKDTDASQSQLAFADLNSLTRGDFIDVTGVHLVTNTGQDSIQARSVRILTKVLRPMPDKLEDKEERMRRRYLDMAINTENRQRFERRSAFWQATRDFLTKREFLEVNVPVLEHTTGGADANPFVTHMDALNEDFFLRISHELPLKRLLGGGFEKVFDIGPRFRNENYSDEHLPEHVAMEWYWAYADWQDGIVLMEGLFRDVLGTAFGKTVFSWSSDSSPEVKEIDFAGPWEQLKYADVIRDNYGIDVFSCTIEEVAEALKEHGLEVEKTDNIPRGIDKLWKNIRKTIAGPVWLVDTPAFISPLSKASDENTDYVQRFQAVIAGSELCNGWSELNDPEDQLNRFMQQQSMRDDGDDEAQMLDMDYVEMLEYGMPPACGLGFSERVFWIFEGVTAREGVPFPQLRREVSESTKSVYPEVYGADGIYAKNSSMKTQDFTKRFVLVVDKTLESWQMANAVAHMSAYLGNKIAVEDFETGDVFLTQDGHALPRNSQYPIIVKRAAAKDLRKLRRKVQDSPVQAHYFTKDMQQSTNDQEIHERTSVQSVEEIEIMGVGVFGENDAVNELTKSFQLWK